MEFGGAVEFGGPGEGLRHFVGRPGILGRLSQGGLSISRRLKEPGVGAGHQGVGCVCR